MQSPSISPTEEGAQCALCAGAVDSHATVVRIGAHETRVCADCTARGRDAAIARARDFLRKRFPLFFGVMSAVASATRRGH